MSSDVRAVREDGGGHDAARAEDWTLPAPPQGRSRPVRSRFHGAHPT